MRNFRRAAASLLLAILAMAAFGDWSKLQTDFRSGKTRDEAVGKIEQSEESQGQDLKELIDDYKSATTKEAKDETYRSIQDLIDANAASEHFSAVEGAGEKAKKIKEGGLYKGEREAKSANWLAKLLDRLKNLFRPQRQNPPNFPNIPAWVPGLIQAIFIIIAVAVVAGLIYLLTKIPWGWVTGKNRKKRAKGGMLEEGEELLSEDQYLAEADRLIAEGRFREACRALYLASLLRLDATRIARFEPTQTNWEHLRRIESSKLRPEGLEFRQATRAFDHAWYGYAARSADDVSIFRETYIAIKHLTEVAK